MPFATLTAYLPIRAEIQAPSWNLELQFDFRRPDHSTSLFDPGSLRPIRRPIKLDNRTRKGSHHRAFPRIFVGQSARNGHAGMEGVVVPDRFAAIDIGAGDREVVLARRKSEPRLVVEADPGRNFGVGHLHGDVVERPLTTTTRDGFQSRSRAAQAQGPRQRHRS